MPFFISGFPVGLNKNYLNPSRIRRALQNHIARGNYSQNIIRLPPDAEARPLQYSIRSISLFSPGTGNGSHATVAALFEAPVDAATVKVLFEPAHIGKEDPVRFRLVAFAKIVAGIVFTAYPGPHGIASAPVIGPQNATGRPEFDEPAPLPVNVNSDVFVQQEPADMIVIALGARTVYLHRNVTTAMRLTIGTIGNFSLCGLVARHDKKFKHCKMTVYCNGMLEKKQCVFVDYPRKIAADFSEMLKFLQEMTKKSFFHACRKVK